MLQLNNDIQQQRQELKDQLVRGDIAKIAKLAFVDVATVRRWFNCKSDNAEVEKYTKAIIKARNKRRQKAVEKALKEENS
tara:strand:+ start:337 stop:576 length:240 start_codon:yes stop_codon:yes gene_type:complete